VKAYVKIVAMDIRVVFMGSPDFALPTLKALTQSFHVVGVVTQPDRPAGRGRKLQPPAVKTSARELGLRIIQPPSLKNPEAIAQLDDMSPDVIVVAAFGQILRENVLTLPQYGCLNVHASLLPRWRGAAPVQAAVLHDDVTGVTIMKMDKGLDTGPILSQKSIIIQDNMTAGVVFEHLACMGADLIVETLPKYVSGEIQPQPQNEADATYAPSLRKNDGKLDFDRPAVFLARQVRAFHPWPGSFQFYNGHRLKVLRAHADEKSDTTPGFRYIIEEKPAWGTVDGLLVLDEVQPAGKGPMLGEDFIRGAQNWA